MKRERWIANTVLPIVVALQDSLDSTLGTKNASNEVRDDMQTIPEGVETQSRRDSFDGPHVRIQEPSERDKDTSDNTAKGLGTAGEGGCEKASMAQIYDISMG